MLAGVGAATVGLATHTVAGHADSGYECDGQPQNTVLLVNHSTGAVTTATGPGALSTQVGAATSSPATTTGSGSGDTVIACHGTYTGPINIPVGKDNITVRSEDGPNGVTIVGDGSNVPVVSVEANGVAFGGPAEGFTITEPKPTGTDLVGIQVGERGAQSTMNEDEQCTTANGAVGSGSGCDQAPPSGVPINDEVIDNVFSNLLPQNTTFSGKIAGIELDNTINTTVQQNLFQNVFGDHSSISTFSGIVVGTIDQAPGAGAPSSFGTGDSTNINVDVLDNSLQNVFQGGNGSCSSATGIALNGFVLDTTVYQNLIQQLVNNNNASCITYGIYSNAYGTLENEQTGTLAPTNANIDDNRIQQLNNNGPQNAGSTGIYLAPNPAGATPQPPTPPTACVSGTPPTKCANDSLPPSAYTVVDNELQQVYTAVDVEALLGANSYVRDNNFDHDVYGIYNGSAVPPGDANLDGTNNWWGCELNGTSAPPTTITGDNHGCAANGGNSAATSTQPPQSESVEQAGDQAGHNAGNN
ncbi:MAG: hypothetical protein JOY80_06885 [Candidatus Dormibacteraeota bacterium]|nr:hypothetical protein [Candidatus Dormibacteraeota bacterium]